MFVTSEDAGQEPKNQLCGYLAVQLQPASAEKVLILHLLPVDYPRLIELLGRNQVFFLVFCPQYEFIVMRLSSALYSHNVYRQICSFAYSEGSRMEIPVRRIHSEHSSVCGFGKISLRYSLIRRQRNICRLCGDSW